ncbi:MAG: fatty acid desaturase [Kofleriaceae bacterium]
MTDDPSDALEPSAGVAGLPITRAELDELQRPRSLRVLAMTALLFACWGALGYAAWRVDSLALRLALWAVAGFLVNGLVQLGHDAWHGNLFPRRWQNTLYGHLFSWPFGVSFSAARHVHLRHHWYNRTARDPDAYNAGKGWRVVVQYYVVVGAGLVLSPLHFNLLYPIACFERRALPRHFAEVALYVAGHVAVWTVLAAHGLAGAALGIWILPIVFATPWNGLKSIADHHRNTWEGDRFHTATTVRTTRLWAWLWNGLNYHLDHHLFPRVPGYRLAEVHAKIAPELARLGAPVFDGYFRVFYGALREGPTYVEHNAFLRRGPTP